MLWLFGCLELEAVLQSFPFVANDSRNLLKTHIQSKLVGPSFWRHFWAQATNWSCTPSYYAFKVKLKGAMASPFALQVLVTEYVAVYC